VIDDTFNGLIGEAFVQVASHPELQGFVGQDEDIMEINDRREYLARVFQMVDLVISPSKFMIEKMEAYGFTHPNMVQLPYGLENVPADLPEREERPAQMRIGYRGRIAPEKGIDILIRAFKMTPGAKLSLHIYGELNERTPYGKKLLKLAQGDDRIHFKGRYNNADLEAILESIDVTVVPSRWYENQPYTILESFAHGIPVIATDLGGMTEMVDHDSNGLLFEFNNADDLALQLQRLLNEPDLLSCLRRGIRPVPRVEEEIRKIEEAYLPILPA
jgi:glycosyltransferase involved in cell wall biosynthesis